MKFKIGYNGKYEDEFIVEGDTIEEIREIVFAEVERRGWESKDCWSERLSD
mgnify:CR=1 FL=1